jgi:hypothetical protein
MPSIKSRSMRERAPDAVLTGSSTRLPYTVELWNLTRSAPERTLAKAASLSIARTIFAAALNEYIGRLIVLRHGLSTIEKSE